MGTGLDVRGPGSLSDSTTSGISINTNTIVFNGLNSVQNKGWVI